MLNVLHVAKCRGSEGRNKRCTVQCIHTECSSQTVADSWLLMTTHLWRKVFPHLVASKRKPLQCWCKGARKGTCINTATEQDMMQDIHYKGSQLTCKHPHMG